MGQPPVSIVILNWNGKADTLECLQSVFALSYSNFEVIVVDNGSSDDSVNAIREKFPAVEILETHRNLGYAGGNNVGIRRACEHNAAFILLLNNDTVVDPQLLVALTHAAEQVPQGGMFSPIIYHHSEPTRIWYAGTIWQDETMDLRIRGWLQIDDGVSFRDMEETDSGIGCALFVRADVVRKVGVMSDDFFLMHEETDWCFRAGRAGFKNIFVPDGKVWHKVSVSFGGGNSPLMSYFKTRNRLLWGERNLPAMQWLRLCGRVLRELFLPFAVDRSTEHSRARQVYWAVHNWREELRRRSTDPVFKAKMWGARDYFLRRFGDCPDAVRRLGK